MDRSSITSPTGERKCPHCTNRVVSTYEGFQEWCTGCGRLYWINPDGTIRGTQVPTVIASHDVCHNLQGKVGAREFADGCAAEQRRLYGCAPDLDARTQLEAKINQMEGEAARTSPGHSGAW